MKYISLVLSGFLLAMLAGCSSGGDGGRINELTGNVSSLEEELETTKAALKMAEDDLAIAQTQLATARLQHNTAQTRLTTVQSELTTTREQLESARTALQTAQTNLAARQRELTTAQEQVDTLTTQLSTATGQVSSLTTQLTQSQTENTNLQTQVTEIEQEESSVESVNRAYGLLEAMDPTTRATGTDATNIGRTHAQTVLGMSHPLSGAHTGHDAPERPRISNNAPNIRQSASGSRFLTVMSDGGKRTPEFTAGGGIPSLTMGSTSLGSALLQRTDPQDNMEELAIYTDFKARNPVLLDHYSDFKAAGVEDEISIANAFSAGTSISVNETMRERTDNMGMYANLPEVLALQPSLSSSRYTANNVVLDEVKSGEFTRVISYETTGDAGTPNQPNDDPIDITVTYTFPATFRGAAGRVQQEIAGPAGLTVGTRLTEAMCTATPGTDGCTAPSFTIMTQIKGTTPQTYEPRSYTLGSGDWTFKPNNATQRIFVDDNHYLYFGWWQVTPDEADGVYDFHVYADGVGRWGATGASYTLEAGSAVYTGGAAGKYVRTVGAHEQLDHAGQRRRDAEAGTFKADVRLEASFGATSTVKGTITNFTDGGTAIPGGWQVILGQGAEAASPADISFGSSGPDLSGDPVAFVKQGGQAGAAPVEDQRGPRGVGGGTNNQGVWEAIFFADEHARFRTSAQPASVVGRFDVGLSAVIHFSGAFGASKN